MSMPTSDLTSLGTAAPGSTSARLVGEPSGERPRRGPRISRDRQRRVRAEARWRRVIHACRRELLRRDAEPGRRRR